VLGGQVLTDDDPHRCCTECRAALWPAGVFAIPGAAGAMRVVLAGQRHRRLEASVSDAGDLVLSWRGVDSPETGIHIDAEDTDLLGVVLATGLMNDGQKLMAWLERSGLGYVGEVEGFVDSCAYTEDGYVAFGGAGGDLLMHGSPARLLLQLVHHTFRHEGYRSIAEFHGWLSGIGLDIARVG
jgi:hypothetical protein